MSKEIIRHIVKLLHKQINDAQENLRDIQENHCKHEETETTDYAWAPGHVFHDVEVCSICGKLLTKFEWTEHKTFSVNDGSEYIDMRNEGD